MEKRWHIKPLPSPEKINALTESINVSEAIAAILIQRGIENYEQAKEFFRPSLSDLHDPFLMKDMNKAVERLDKAIDSGEKILIYGDYDVDGTTSVALVYDFLSEFYINIDFYVPDRYKEGYGVSFTAMDWAIENGFSLIISLDCGIKSSEQIAYAKAHGIEFIVCDHHNPGTTLPDAYAVLDPKRKDCPYPFKELSGCGVGFKLMQAWCIKNQVPLEGLFNYLDLLVVSIAADIVPMNGENRILAFFGLDMINRNPRPGLKALIQVAGFTKELNVSNVVFGIAPRINAAGRIDHAKAVVQLLLSKNEEQAERYASEVDKKNTIRKSFDSSITRQAISMIEEDDFLRNAKTTVLYKEDWNKGVIGIVASKCIDKYYRPTIILTHSEGKAAGSARSVHGFDVHEAISRCSDLLLQFGGHMYAAGLSLKTENIDAFRQKFESTVSEMITDDQMIPQLEIDYRLGFEHINQKFYKVLSQLGPFGPMNMQPVFLVENVKDNGSARLLKDLHLKLHIKDDKGHGFDAIGFNMPEYFERIKKGENFNACFTIEENSFNGRTSLQLMIKDIQFNKN